MELASVRSFLYFLPSILPFFTHHTRTVEGMGLARYFSSGSSCLMLCASLTMTSCRSAIIGYLRAVSTTWLAVVSLP